MSSNERLGRYRDLSGLDAGDWKNLDIHLYILANYPRYSAMVVNRIGSRHLPNDIWHTLPGLFCEVAYRPMKAIHEKHLDAEGQRRNQLMLGTLKMISLTRMVEAVVREYPVHHSLDALFETDDENAACSDMGGSVEEDVEPDDALVVMLEWLRPHITHTQYRHLYHLVCEGKSFADIAAMTGSSITNVRVLIHHARERMLGLLPQELSSLGEAYRHRNSLMP